MTGPDGRPGDGFTLGVDLGTSHTVAMLRWPDGRTRPLLFDGQPLLPSAVYLDAGGRIHVGRDALRLGHAEPARFEPNPKRHIDAEKVLLGGAEVPVAELLAGLLGAVAREAVAAVGFLPPAVVTFPAAWGARRRAVLTDALVRAGWPAKTQFVPEPVAAARYFADVLRRPVPVGSALAVFDFGGGTLDIAVVRNAGLAPDGHPRFEVAASGGAGDLGGLDVDAALVEYLGQDLADAEPAAWKALTDPVTLAQWRSRRQFWDDVRGAKEMLSRSSAAPVPVPGVEHAVQLTRDELEGAAGPLIRRGVAEAATVIKAAGLTPGELAGLFLVGGSSRVPMVARLLHSELGIAPTVLEQPELPVSEGAIRAAGASGTHQWNAAGSPPSVAARPPTETVAAAGPPTETVDAAAAGGAPPTADTVPSRPPPAQALPTDPDYAEPVDPWATGEAAAIAAAGGAPLFPSSGAPSMRATSAPPAHESWLASAQPDEPPPTAPEAIAGGGRRAAYRRKLLLIVAAATVVVVGAGAVLAWIFWPDYPALDFAQKLGPPTVVAPLQPVSSGFSDAAILGDRVYFASSVEDSAAPDVDRLAVVAADVRTGEALWNSAQAGTAQRWDRMVAIPAGLALLTDSESSSGKRRFAILGAGKGELLWQRTIDRDDSIFFVDDIAVLVDRTENRLLGLEINGRGNVAWEQPNIRNSTGTATASVYQITTPADLSGPAGATGVPFAPDQDDDKRIVQVSADRSARILDIATGELMGSARPGVADYDDPVIAHNGRLIVRESSTPQRIVAYNLNKLNEGQPRVLYTAPGDNLQLTGLTPCGDDRVCWIEEAGYDAATAQVAGVNAADGSGAWRQKVVSAETLVPVGDSVLVTQSTSPVATVSLLDAAAGKVSWTENGTAARLDGGNLLTFSNPLSTSPDNPSLAGQHLGDEAKELGPLTGVRSSTCSWNTSVIACVRDKDFAIQRFVD